MSESDQTTEIHPKVTVGWRIRVLPKTEDEGPDAWWTYVASPHGGNALRPSTAFTFTRKSHAKHAAALWRHAWRVRMVRVTSRRRPRQ